MHPFPLGVFAPRGRGAGERLPLLHATSPGLTRTKLPTGGGGRRSSSRSNLVQRGRQQGDIRGIEDVF